MATNWVKAQTVEANGAATTQSATITAPMSGSLLKIAVWYEAGTTAPTSFAISDNSTGQGAWTAIAAIQRPGASSRFAAQSFYKISDGTETSVTSTESGGVGGTSGHAVVVSNYTVTGGGTIANDLSLGGTASSATSFSVSPASGSSQPSNTDELALIDWGILNVGNAPDSASFTGTSALASAALESTSDDTFIAVYF